MNDTKRGSLGRVLARRAERFWDRRAREDAFFFVDNRQPYRATDLERFWSAGERDLLEMLALLDVAPRPEDRVVEVGCGVGRLTRALAARAQSVHAIDISQRMLSIARLHNAHLGNVEWLHGDGVSLRPLPDGRFDACVSHVVFQHIPDPQVTLGYVREMGRVLRPGGWAAFQVSNDPRIHLPPPDRGLRPRLRALLGRAPRGQRHPAWLGSAVELGALERAAREGGLEIERVVNPGTQFCYVLARRRPAGRLAPGPSEHR